MAEIPEPADGPKGSYAGIPREIACLMETQNGRRFWMGQTAIVRVRALVAPQTTEEDRYELLRTE